MSDPAVERVAVLGGGSWGTALAIVLAENVPEVVLWGRDAEAMADVAERRENRRYLPGRTLPEGVRPTSDLSDVADLGILFSVVPSAAVRPLFQQMEADGQIAADAVVVSCTKGIELDTGRTMGAILEEVLPGREIAVLSGPSHAEEVGGCRATALLVGAEEPSTAARLQRLLVTPWLRPYTSDDIMGIEWGGAVKNVFAIAAGIADGLDPVSYTHLTLPTTVIV